MAQVIKNPLTNAGDVRDTDLVPGLGRSPGGENSNLLQYSCLGNPMDRQEWRDLASMHVSSSLALSTRLDPSGPLWIFLVYSTPGLGLFLGYNASGMQLPLSVSDTREIQKSRSSSSCCSDFHGSHFQTYISVLLSSFLFFLPFLSLKAINLWSTIWSG